MDPIATPPGTSNRRLVRGAITSAALRRHFLAAVFAVATVALAGCSSNPPSSTSPPPKRTGPMSRSEFLTEANGLCNQVNEGGAGLNATPSDPAQQLDLLRARLAVYEAAINKIKALPPPPGDKATLASIFVKIDAATKLLTEQIDDQKAGKQAEAAALSDQVSAAGNAANVAMSGYGLVYCEES